MRRDDVSASFIKRDPPMQRHLALALSLGGALVAACDSADRPAPTAAAPLLLTQQVAPPPGAFLTAQPAQARAAVPQATVTPIITTGDQLANGYTFAPTPDGLGAYRDGDRLIVYVNHELTAGGVRTDAGPNAYPYARVSRLALDPGSLAVTDAAEVLGPAGQYQRLCSATWVGAAAGFPSGYFLT